MRQIWCWMRTMIPAKLESPRLGRSNLRGTKGFYSIAFDETCSNLCRFGSAPSSKPCCTATAAVTCLVIYVYQLVNCTRRMHPAQYISTFDPKPINRGFLSDHISITSFEHDLISGSESHSLGPFPGDAGHLYFVQEGKR